MDNSTNDEIRSGLKSNLCANKRQNTDKDNPLKQKITSSAVIMSTMNRQLLNFKSIFMLAQK